MCVENFGFLVLVVQVHLRDLVMNGNLKFYPKCPAVGAHK